jgi:NADH-quinone oxidoreductase subunit C
MIPEPLETAELLYLAKMSLQRTGLAWLAVLEPGQVPETAAKLLSAGYHLEDICGLDIQEGGCAVYHFEHFNSPGRIALAAVSPYEPRPLFPSIAGIYQGAEWHERETRDFFGYCFEGNPNFIPLLLAEDMAELHPLQKAASSRAPLRAFFSAEGSVEEVLRKKTGFTFLDAPPSAEAADAARAGAVDGQEGKAQ